MWPFCGKGKTSVGLLHAGENEPQIDDLAPPFPGIDVVPVDGLRQRLGFAEALRFPAASRCKPLTSWRMEDDDAPVFRYLYRNFSPNRHLEFGTWQGSGTLYCLEECQATVWTINLLEGECKSDGEWAYGELLPEDGPAAAWSEFREAPVEGKRWIRTDAFGFIGHFYREKNLAHRVCQIYCDSRDWDIRAYPPGFFDSALIDGGHQEDVVLSDTHKALRLVRSGGLILWHDYCPVVEVYRTAASVRGVTHAIAAMRERLRGVCSDLFWIEPSWLLVGVKR